MRCVPTPLGGIFAALQQTSGDLFAFAGLKNYDRHYTFELINI
jgi:hypothetical protein